MHISRSSQSTFDWPEDCVIPSDVVGAKPEHLPHQQASRFDMTSETTENRIYLF
jgi:hypothetical protein